MNLHVKNYMLFIIYKKSVFSTLCKLCNFCDNHRIQHQNSLHMPHLNPDAAGNVYIQYGVKRFSDQIIVIQIHKFVCGRSLVNPLSPHDALKHHFTSLKTHLILLQQSVLERKFY